MAFRKYDTSFFERYAMLALQTILGHKFDDLVNEDRPDLQSADHKRLGIEVTRAMDGGKEGAQQMLKDLAGVSARTEEEGVDFRRIIENGYGYGLQDGKYVGGLELNYWKTAKPMKEILKSKVSKVSSGFYGEYDEFGLYVFCKDPMSLQDVQRTVRFIMDLQKDLETRYRRLFISSVDTLYACNLEDGLQFDYRISDYPIEKSQRKEFFLNALNLEA